MENFRLFPKWADIKFYKFEEFSSCWSQKCAKCWFILHFCNCILSFFFVILHNHNAMKLNNDCWWLWKTWWVIKWRKCKINPTFCTFLRSAWRELLKSVNKPEIGLFWKKSKIFHEEKFQKIRIFQQLYRN